MNDEIIEGVIEEVSEATTALVVVLPARNAQIEAAMRGLRGELSDLSWAMYSRAIYDFLAYLEANKTTDFGGSLAVVLSSWLKSLSEAGLSPSTVKVKLVQIRRFVSWGVRVGWADHAALLDVQEVKVPKSIGGRHGNWIDQNTMQRILNSIDGSTLMGKRDRALFALLFGCGLRREETTTLRWSHFTRQGNTWAITDLKRKHNRTQALIAVPDWVMKLLRDWNPDGSGEDHVIVSIDKHGNLRDSITGDGIWRIVKKWAGAFDLGKFAPHDARRSFARVAKLNGLEMSQLSQTLGHSTIAVTERYVNDIYNYEAVAKAVQLEV